MKQILLYAAIFALFFAGSWLVRRAFFTDKPAKTTAQIDKNKIPRTNFKVKSEIINLGKIYKMDTVIKCDFVIYNLGPEDLYIFNVKPDCKCTGYSKIDKDKPVAPKDSSIITLEYKPKAPGTFQVTASVETNAENNAFLILRGEVADLAIK
jgi:hypothetical protein